MFDYRQAQSAIDHILGKELFFIVGTIKSGTTWLQLLLDAHGDISCGGESHFTNVLAKNLTAAVSRYNQKIAAKNETIFKEVEGYPVLRKPNLRYLLFSSICLLLHDQSKDKDPRVVGEKTPDNIRGMALLRELFPGAKFLHTIRDGRDAAVSAWFHNLRVTPDWTRENFGSMADYLAHYGKTWVREIGLARDFGGRFPDHYREVRYEGLFNQPADSLRSILEFVGVDAGPETIAHCLAAGDFAGLASGRKPGHEDRSSHFRKGVVGDWRNHFDDESLARFN